MDGIRSSDVRMADDISNADTFDILDGKNTFGKQGLIQQIKAKREKSRLDKIEKMKSVLRKQGIIVNEDVTEIEEEPNEHKQAEPKVKFYGQEMLAAF